MASAFGHIAVAYALGKSLNPVWHSKRFWLLTALCCVLPDADVLGLVFGIPYEHVLGHRVLTHSIVFAIVVGIFMPKLLAADLSYQVRRYWILAIYFSLVILSHGVLDAWTDGGLGVAFFAPFDGTRYFFPWRPITVSPIGLTQFFSSWGLAVLFSELVWIGLPVTFWLLCQRLRSKAE